jgi:hypothetical protein
MGIFVTTARYYDVYCFKQGVLIYCERGLNFLQIAQLMSTHFDGDLKLYGKDGRLVYEKKG